MVAQRGVIQHVDKCVDRYGLVVLVCRRSGCVHQQHDIRDLGSPSIDVTLLCAVDEELGMGQGWSGHARGAYDPGNAHLVAVRIKSSQDTHSTNNFPSHVGSLFRFE